MIAKLGAVVILGTLIIGGIFVGIPYASYISQPDKHIDAYVTVGPSRMGEYAVQLNASANNGRGGFSSYLGHYWSTAPDPDQIGEWKVEYSVGQLLEGGDVWLLQETCVFSSLSMIHFGFSVIIPEQGYFSVTAILFAKGSAGLIDAMVGQDQVLLVVH